MLATFILIFSFYAHACEDGEIRVSYNSYFIAGCGLWIYDIKTEKCIDNKWIEIAPSKAHRVGNAPYGTPCDDLDPCTEYDHCDNNGNCIGGTPVCNASPSSPNDCQCP